MIDRLRVRNYRGVRIPAIIGLVLAAFGAASVLAIELLASGGVTRAGWIATIAAGAVTIAGLVDDLVAAGPRGLRAHLRVLASGRVTTGVVKLLVITACATASVLTVADRTVAARVAGVLLVAASANLWNGLDVRPGRALKFFYPAGVAILRVPWPVAPFLPGVLLGAVLVLPWDVGERAMLGDAGSNLLGFSAGIALFHELHGAALIVGASTAVALNVLAETVTLSKVIGSIPPIRWYDRIGRRSRS